MANIGWRHPRPRRRDARGAGLVEYALVVSLLVGAGLGAMSSFEQESGDALVARGDSIGAPDVESGISTTIAPSPPTTNNDATTTTSAPPVPPVSTLVSATSSAYANNKKWTATVVINVTDDEGDPVHRATVTAVWNPSAGSPVTVSCETQPSGNCTFTLRELGTLGASVPVASVTFDVTGVTPVGGTTSDPDLQVFVSEPT